MMVFWGVVVTKASSYTLVIKQELPISYKSHFKDSVKVVNELNNVVAQLREKGYLLANVDSQYYAKDTLWGDLNVGECYQWVEVDTKSIDQLLRKVGKKHLFESGNVVNYELFLRIESDLLNYVNNHGYPFAKINFVPTKLGEGEIKGRWNCDLQKLFVFDSLIIDYKGINANFLAKTLGFKKGTIYSKKKIDEIPKQLQQLGFLTMTKPMEVLFTEKTFGLVLHLEKRKQNTLQGLVGFLPNESGGLLVTGDVDFHLTNIFRRGIQFDAVWKKADLYSQQLTIEYHHPYLLNSIISPKVRLEVWKQDTSFLTVDRHLGFSFYPSLTNRFDMGVVYETSQSLQQDTSYQDFSKLSYSLAYQYTSLDNYWFPKKGHQLNGVLEIGEKNIVTEDLMIAPITWQWLWKLKYQFYTKLYKRWYFYTKIVYQGVQNSEEQLWENDLFQFGGLRTIRGFNENEFRASQWSLLNVETRFWIDETSFFFLFYNQGYYWYLDEQWLQGAGIGTQLKVRSGNFNFAVAWGKSQDVQLSGINLFKVHFGLVAKF
ncbi:MAG: BamA/TamA family outer membrane protein [Cytophagales bacterium]|nr:BamA/TamA family outer membrane protein [Cytophagales bacterium]